MGLYEQIRDISKSQGYSINKLEQELGFARSSISKFNKNKPSIDKLRKIADFLGVTVDYLMTGKEESKEKSPELTARDERDIAKDLNNIMEKIENGEDGPLCYNGEEVDKESLELLRDAIGMSLRHLKIVNKEKYNPHKNKK
ncbi:MAG: helix-turn-helix domain-containing protein [Bariatricus sp.]